MDGRCRACVRITFAWFRSEGIDLAATAGSPGSARVDEPLAASRRTPRIAAVDDDALRLAPGERRSALELSEGTPLLVHRGAVIVARAAVAGRRIVLGVLGRECVIRPPRPDEEIIALTSAVVAPVEPSPDQLLEALRDREESLAILAFPRHTDRVRAKLIQLARMHGRVTGGGVVIPLPLTHELIADMTASARETVTWALRELVEEGFVTRTGRQYVVRMAPEEVAEL